MRSRRDVRIGVDIGGTFTDLLLYDPASRRFTIEKTLTTPADPSRAVASGVDAVLASAGVGAERVGQIIHGTTLVTNALIERRGAPTALLTTAGFRDAVAIGREHRYDLYDIHIELPEPLVPRRWRLELDERILADGTVERALDPRQVRALAGRLRQGGIQAVAVCLLHAYRDDRHEREVAAILAEVAPDLVVSLSSEVAPEIREYQRASTTICNVYARPIVDGYLERLERSLAAQGIAAPLLIMLSSGGTCTVETARRFPIRLVESGPAAGALAAARAGRAIGQPNLLSFDMGGTTAKACLIDGGEPLIASEFEVGRVYRFKKGSGFPVQVPVIEMIEIGAGGGSIATIDRMGLLKVGPRSAGAEPGPVCYGRGGRQPTVTDADLVLGYLDPDFFLGGALRLDRDAAAEAIAEQIARPLGLGTVEAAWGIHQLVNETMANAARMHAVERGKDPRRYPLYAFGGAGPVHAYGVARLLGSPGLLIPAGAGVLSAAGLLVAPISFDFTRTLVGRLDELDWSEIDRLYGEMEGEAAGMLRAAGLREADIGYRREAELRYAGQGHQVRVAAPAGRLTDAARAELATGFEAAYRGLYGRTAPGNPIEAVNWRLTARGPRPELPLGHLGVGRRGRSRDAVKGRRQMYVPELGDFREVVVYDRDALSPGDQIAGPAIVEERESTLILGQAAHAVVDEALNVLATLASHG